MDTTYKSELENPFLKRRLLVADNIPAIEDLLDKESQRLRRLQKLKEGGRLDFGSTVSYEELKELFPQVCREVDNFLGIQDGDTPRCGYFNLLNPGIMSTGILLMYTSSAGMIAGALASLFSNQNPDASLSNALGYVGTGMCFLVMAATSHSTAKEPYYSPLSRKITLERVARTDLIPMAGHEYTHHVQHGKGIASEKYFIFQEGHAIGVQRQLAGEYHEREDNEAFLYSTSDRNAGELKSAYLWMCKKLGREPRKSLLKTKTNRDDAEKRERSFGGKPTPHAIGNALFSIYESLHGKEIYKQMIQGNFQFA